MTLQQQEPEILTDIQAGLDFILLHLSGPTFPRRISTQKSHNKQFTVDSIEEVIAAYLDSEFVDCRISAFPLLREGKSWVPDLLFIDLDLANFKTEKALQIALSNTLRNISNYFDNDSKPTVLWSGNGYHVIQPVECPVTEYHLRHVFQDFVESSTISSNPAQEFLRFAKIFLSDNKADKSNYPSFMSCLLRIPNSINLKSKNNTKVKIIQEWNLYRPTITRELFGEFKVYLIQKKIDLYLQQQKLLERRKQKNGNNNQEKVNHGSGYYEWIEKILKIPFEDGRKIILSLILAPYLVNIRKLSFQQSYNILKTWLTKCDSLRKLDFNSDYLINSSLNTAFKKRIPPMRLETLRIRNMQLYQMATAKN